MKADCGSLMAKTG